MKELKFLITLVLVLVIGVSVIFAVRLGALESQNQELLQSQEINHDYLVGIKFITENTKAWVKTGNKFTVQRIDIVLDKINDLLERQEYDHKLYVKDNISIHNKLTYLQENSITDQTKARLSTYLHLRYMDYKDQYEDNAGYSYGVERYLKGKLEIIQAVLTLFCDYGI